MSGRSQDEFIMILGQHVKSTIIRRVNEVPFFSIMTDSTPDNSHREIYSLVIRFVVNFQVEERVVTIKELPSKTGEKICQFVLDCLNECQISTDRLIAQCYDNAPNMAGCHKGVQACMTSTLKRDIMHIPCASHTSNLAVRHACDCATEFVSFFGYVEELYKFFSTSMKRYYILRQRIDASPYGLFVKNLSSTRWSASYDALNAIHVSQKEIIESLDSIIDDLDEDKIKCSIEDKKTKAQVSFLRHFFRCLILGMKHCLPMHRLKIY
jgi:hypothetical protein